MIDHVSIAISDLARATAFYEKLLATLGHERLVTREGSAGFGKTYPEFWIHLREDAAAPSTGHHIALRARDMETVEKFHEAALANGAACDGPPGLRRASRDGYYAAFIRDADGNRIEAVTFLGDGSGVAD